MLCIEREKDNEKVSLPLKSLHSNEEDQKSDNFGNQGKILCWRWAQGAMETHRKGTQWGRMGGRRFWEASQEAGRCTEAQVVLEWELACEGEEGVSSGF